VRRSGRTDGRLPMHRGVARGRAVTIYIDGTEVRAFLGETVAAAAIAAGFRALRSSLRVREPRGLFCGIGVCFECLITVDGAVGVRACMTPVAPGMVIELTAAEAPDG
jgi:aerobic-type carbon monoxide dehydrogenase small subunit (CoxS/CutS family)